VPLTPLHFLAVASLHFKRPEIFDITALLFSSTFVDLELVFFLLTAHHMSHRLWHSYFFVLTAYPAVLSLILYFAERRFEGKIKSVARFFMFSPKKIKYSFKQIYFSCLIGGVSHIFFDMWTHEVSSYVLFPFYEGNPFWIGEWSIIILSLVALLSIYTVFLWMRQLQDNRKRVDHIIAT